MADYLLIRLYGPLVSWGDIAVGETRRSAVHPSRSALLGFLGAALGIERDDEAGQRALAAGYRFGIKLEAAGLPLRDYHTVGVGVPPRKARFRFRRQELAAEKVDTTLTEREYRCDSLALVAIEATATAPYDLSHVARALRQPHFSLYLGRKSCPLAIPLAPVLTSAATLREVLDETGLPPLLGLSERNQAWPSYLDRRVFQLGRPRYYWEDGMQSGIDASFESQRHDQPHSRSRWQFSLRREWVALPGQEK